MSDNKFIGRTLSLTTAYQPVVTSSLTGTVRVCCPPGNTGAVTMLGDDGSDVGWTNGEMQDFVGVDVSTLRFKSTVPGDIIEVKGHTGRAS